MQALHAALIFLATFCSPYKLDRNYTIVHTYCLFCPPTNSVHACQLKLGLHNLIIDITIQCHILDTQTALHESLFRNSSNSEEAIVWQFFNQLLHGKKRQEWLLSPRCMGQP